MKIKPKGTHCQGRTKAGKPCRAASTAGGLCFFHANPNKARELGRLGGQNNRHVAVGTADALPALDNATGVRETGARAIQDLLSGKLDPKTATALVPLLYQQTRAIVTTELAQLLAELKKAKAETKTKVDAEAKAETKAKAKPEPEPEDESWASPEDPDEGPTE